MVCTLFFSCDGKFFLEAVFWGYLTILGQINCRLISLIMEIFAPSSWNFELVQLFLSTWIVDCLLPEARMVCTVNNFSQGSWNFEFSTFFISIG